MKTPKVKVVECVTWRDYEGKRTIVYRVFIKRWWGWKMTDAFPYYEREQAISFAKALASYEGDKENVVWTNEGTV